MLQENKETNAFYRREERKGDATRGVGGGEKRPRDQEEACTAPYCRVAICRLQQAVSMRSCGYAVILREGGLPRSFCFSEIFHFSTASSQRQSHSSTLRRARSLSNATNNGTGQAQGQYRRGGCSASAPKTCSSWSGRAQERSEEAEDKIDGR